MIRVFFIILILGVLIGGADFVRAQTFDMKKINTSESVKGEAIIVDTNRQRISVREEDEEGYGTYKIGGCTLGEETAITKGGTPITLEDIPVGSLVHITYDVWTTGIRECKKINLLDKEAADE